MRFLTPQGFERLGRVGFVALFAALGGCTVDPGNDFSGANVTFNADYYYCHVEPELIFAKKCGPGDPAAGDNGNCHFSPAVPGMHLLDHPAIDCSPTGDHPSLTGLMATGTNSPAESNLVSVSTEMSLDYMTSQLFVRPTGQAIHPRQIFPPTDPNANLLLSTWATK